MVYFTGDMGVEGLEVDCAPWLAILLWADYHAVAPGDWRPYGNRFNDHQPHILVGPCLDFVLCFVLRLVGGYWV